MHAKVVNFKSALNDCLLQWCIQTSKAVKVHMKLFAITIVLRKISFIAVVPIYAINCNRAYTISEFQKWIQKLPFAIVQTYTVPVIINTQ